VRIKCGFCGSDVVIFPEKKRGAMRPYQAWCCNVNCGVVGPVAETVDAAFEKWDKLMNGTGSGS